MYPVSAQFLAALRNSHTVAARVDAYSAGRCVARNIPFTDGSVSVSSGTGVHRKLDLTIADPGLWDVLSPVGTELRAWRGIRFPGGAEELLPLGVFSLDQQSMSVGALSTIAVSSAPDRWAQIQRARFELPRTSEHALTAVASIARLVAEVVPNATDTAGVSGLNPIADARTTVQVWDRDRDAAITGLCTQSGTEAFFGPRGNLIIRDVATMDTHPVWAVHTGRDGVMLSGTAIRDRTRVYNVVVVVSSKTDGTPPFQPQVVEDADPDSVTNVNGPYGRVPYFLTSATIAGPAAARAAGQALLAKTRGRFVDMTVSAVTNPALESGDTISVTGLDGGTQLFVVDSFTVPLTTEASQSLTLRTLAAVTNDSSSDATTTA
jgi:hypothetical protein